MVYCCPRHYQTASKDNSTKASDSMNPPVVGKPGKREVTSLSQYATLIFARFITILSNSHHRAYKVSLIGLRVLFWGKCFQPVFTFV